MATTDDDTDEFTTPFPDDELPSETRDTVTIEFCPPFPPSSAAQPLTFDPNWRTETVLALARGIDADSAFDRLPILADALEEAGCDHPQLLHHCRTCPHPFASCWVVNVVLDRVPGELPPTSGGPQLLGDLLPTPEQPMPERPRLQFGQTGPRVGAAIVRVILVIVAGFLYLVFQGRQSNSSQSFPEHPNRRSPTLPTELSPAAREALVDAMRPGRVVNGKVIREGDPGWDDAKRHVPPPTTRP